MQKVFAECAVGAVRKPQRIVNKRFAQGCAASIVQEHCTVEEVEEHLTTTRTVNDEQALSVEDIISAHKKLIEAHDSLEHRIKEVSACMKGLRQFTLWVREHPQFSPSSCSEGNQRGHA